MKKILAITLMLIITIACGEGRIQEQPAPEDQTATQIAGTVIAIMQEEESIPTSAPEPTPTTLLGARLNPMPMGQPFNGIFDGTKYFDIAITRVIRGQEANQMVKSANMFNEDPPQGQEYLLAYAVLNYLTCDDSDTLLQVDFTNFEAVSNNQIIETPWGIVEPEPSFDLKLYPEGTGEGWILLLVFSDDPAPIISFGAMFDSSNRFFFSTN